MARMFKFAALVRKQYDRGEEMVYPRGKFERSINHLLQGLCLYLEAHSETYGGEISPHDPLAESWLEVLSGTKGLLNGNIGRLDPAVIDTLLRRLEAAVDGIEEVEDVPTHR